MYPPPPAAKGEEGGLLLRIPVKAKADSLRPAPPTTDCRRGRFRRLMGRKEVLFRSSSSSSLSHHHYYLRSRSAIEGKGRGGGGMALNLWPPICRPKAEERFFSSFHTHTGSKGQKRENVLQTVSLPTPSYSVYLMVHLGGAELRSTRRLWRRKEEINII